MLTEGNILILNRWIYSGHSGGSGSGTVAASGGPGGRISTGLAGELEKPVAILQPPQWIQCDLRFFDMRILGTLQYTTRYYTVVSQNGISFLNSLHLIQMC